MKNEQSEFKAAVRRKYGPPSVLSIENFIIPKPKDDEILVRVRSSTVNRTDCGALWGKPFIFRLFIGILKPKDASTGSDFAGEVVAVGKGLNNFKVGERIFGFNDEGMSSHRQFVCLKADQAIALVPDSISFEQAAASIEGAHYAFNFISKVSLKAGDQVLVNGATGAIGSAAIQILKADGVHITAVCATAHLETAKSLGASRVFDYLKEDFTEANDQYDCIFDAVGKSSFRRCKHLLKKGGSYLSSELGERMENPFLALLTHFYGDKKVIFPIPVKIQESVDKIRNLLDGKEFTALVDRSYLLEEIAAAYTYVDLGQKIGNVLISFD